MKVFYMCELCEEIGIKKFTIKKKNGPVFYRDSSIEIIRESSIFTTRNGDVVDFTIDYDNNSVKIIFVFDYENREIGSMPLEEALGRISVDDMATYIDAMRYTARYEPTYGATQPSQENITADVISTPVDYSSDYFWGYTPPYRNRYFESPLFRYVDSHIR